MFKKPKHTKTKRPIFSNSRVLRKKCLLGYLLVGSFIQGLLSGKLEAQNLEENLLEVQEENSEQSELIEQVSRNWQSPLNLNTATLKEFLELPDIDEEIARAIIQYRKKIGGYHSIEQILKIPGVDIEVLEKIAQFFSVESANRTPVLSNFHFRSRVSDQLTTRSTPQKIYNRLTFQVLNHVEGGLLLEKDAGESRIDDLRLFHLKAKVGNTLQAIVGNYQLQIGQGLVFWGPYGLAKGAMATAPVRKKGRDVLPYRSVNENAGLFGAAISYENTRAKLIFFASKNQMDATPISDTAVTTISETGLHRNENELARRNALEEKLLGLRIAYSPRPAIKLGVTHYRSKFNKAILNPDLKRKHFEFRGRTNSAVGLDWLYAKHPINMFGELARSANSGMALVIGVQLKTPLAKLAFTYRNYQKKFQNFHGYGFGEQGGKIQNETGYYTGLEYKLSRKITIRAYYDVFSFPWRSFFEPMPRSGHDFLLQIEHKFNRRLFLTFRYKAKSNEIYESILSGSVQPESRLINKTRAQTRMQLDMAVTKDVQLRTRLEYVKLTQTQPPGISRQSRENGFSLYQNFRVRLGKSAIICRLSLFEAGSFDARIYQYEYDLPGVLTNRALSGRGSRWFILFRYRPNFPLAFHIKYSETYRDDGISVLKSDKSLAIQFDLGK